MENVRQTNVLASKEPPKMANVKTARCMKKLKELRENHVDQINVMIHRKFLEMVHANSANSLDMLQTIIKIASLTIA
jgi:hypothetical protein